MPPDLAPFVQFNIREKRIHCPQVDEATEFEPQVRGEIGAFGWHFVASLPASEEAAMQYNTAEGAKHKFYQARLPSLHAPCCAACCQRAMRMQP
jgi:hypothetical protein